MQCSVPELRPVANVRLFNAELRQFGNDLDKWRLYKVRAPYASYWWRKQPAEPMNTGVVVA